MILYHGTNCDIQKPDPRKGHRGTDFGQGFYLTPAMDVVYRSKLFKKLEDTATGHYREGPVYLYDMICEERGIKSKV